jgi:cation diffusion facilitator CzcD-associated flavoprotein CzcO
MTVRSLPSSIPLAFVGAGLHSVTIACHLLEWGLIDPASVAFFDPSGAPLAEWTELTTRMGMITMRSPWMHHVHPEMMDLVDWARRRGCDALGPGYPTPPVLLFNRYCQEKARPFYNRTWAESVVRIEPAYGQYRLHLASGTVVQAERVVYAPGMKGMERIPAPASTLRSTHPALVPLAAEVDVQQPGWSGQRVLIVGAGLTGGTLALRLAERGAHVTLIQRGQIRRRKYDVDEAWMKNRGKIRRFQRLTDPHERLRVLQGARRGSVTPAILQSLQALASEGRVDLCPECELKTLTLGPTGRLQVRLTLAGEERVASYDRVILAIGYDLDLGRHQPLQEALALAGRPLVGGRPLLGDGLQLLPGLHLSGWAAELKIGPQARNIIGARIAARILRALPIWDRDRMLG